MTVRVSETGAVIEAWVLNSDAAELEPVACAFVRGLSFRPAMKDGKPVATNITYLFEYQPDE